MSITGKGKKWEILNSLWIIWSFVFGLNYAGFFWIGYRTKQKKWVLFGCLYLVLGFAVPMYASGASVKGTLLSTILMLIWFGSWVVSAIHSFLSRKEYLLRREAIVNGKKAAELAFRQNIQNEYQQPEVRTVQTVQPPQTVPPAAAQQPVTQKIELNTCSENQLADLPGVGVVLSKKAIAIRNGAGGFASVDDFCSKLGLMPHFAVQIEKLAYVSAAMPPKQATENTGRVIDI